MHAVFRTLFSWLQWLWHALSMLVAAPVWYACYRSALLHCENGVTRNIVYSTHQSRAGKPQKLDVYSQLDGPQKRFRSPVVVFVHGGAWSSGCKAMYAFVGRFFQSLGFVCVLPNFSRYPEGDVRDMISDLDVCMAWVLREINAYGGDPENIHLIGHSSGAHLTSLLLVFHLCRLAEVKPGSYDRVHLERTLEECAIPFSPMEAHEPGPHADPDHWIHRVRTFFGLCGVYDIYDHYDHECYRCVEMLSPMERTMLGQDRFLDFSPTFWLSCNSFCYNPETVPRPPAFRLVHGGKDITVPCKASDKFTKMYSRWKGSNQDVKLRHYYQFGHTDMMYTLIKRQLRKFNAKWITHPLSPASIQGEVVLWDHVVDTMLQVAPERF